MSYGPRPKNGNYTARQLARFLDVSLELAEEAIRARPGTPQRQIDYATRKDLELNGGVVTPKIKVTSTSNLVIDGKNARKKSTKFFDICQAFDALNLDRYDDWAEVGQGYIRARAEGVPARIEYKDKETTYIFSN
jgi:hypothetical protein